MNTMMKRFFSLILSIFMLVGILPANAWAAGTDVVADALTGFTAANARAGTVLDAAIFCSDVHGSTSDLENVMAGVKTSGVTYSSIGFVGDTCLTVANTESTVNSGLGYTPTVMFSYASSHDTENGSDISTKWDYSGEVEDVSENYLVYTIRETDMQNDTTAEDDFTAWYSGLTAAEKALPIFIMSHRPLHHRRKDNANATDWYNAISAAAKSSDIVVFWAHNHTSENSVDTAAYYVAKNGTESFTLGTTSSSGGDTVVPNFTYMNAGYINANNQDPARLGIATTVQITADSLVFQDYNSSGAYTGTYAHNETVAREFAASEPAATLTGIAVSGETEYTVGGNGLNLTVTASYDDGSTADVTADATFAPAELTVSGVHTVTASYGGMTATIDVTVTLYDEVLAADGESLLVAVEAFSQGATALEVTWDDAADAILDAAGLYTDYVVYDLALTNPGETTEYAMTIADNMDTSNLVVYHVADDGTLTSVPFEIVGETIVFTTSLTGAFAYGSVAVPEGYTLTSLTLENIPTDLFVGGSLDLMNAEITAIYTKEGAEDFVRELTVYDYDVNNFSGYDVNVAGAQTAVFTFEGVTAELPIHVWGDEFTVSDVTVHVGEGEYGVTEAVVSESTNTNVATAIQYVIEGDNYVAYDITLTYSSGYAANDADKTVTLPIPEGITNPVVYYVSDNGKSVVDMKAVNNGNGTVTFTTNHFSTYVLGDGTSIETESGNATVEGTEDETTTTKVAEEVTVYKLVSTPVSGNTYLIVNSNNGDGYGLDGDTTGYATTAFTGGSDYYATWDDSSKTGTAFAAGSDVYLTTSGAYLWTAGSNSFAIGYNQSSEGSILSGYTYTYTLNPSSSSGDWTLSDSKLSISLTASSRGILGGTSSNATYYLTNSGSSWSMTTGSGSNVYFYEPVTVYKVTEQETTIPGDVGHTYSAEGTDITDAAAIAGQTVTLSSILYDTPTDTNTKTDITVSSGLTPTYEVVTTKGNPTVIAQDEDGNYLISGNTATLSGTTGTAVVKVTYTSGDLVAWDEFIVTANAPDHYGIQLHLNNDGVLGEEITAPVALKGVEAGDTYSVWAVVKAYATADDTTGTDLGTLGDALSWTVSDPSIATIDTTTGVITFTGDNYGTIDVTVAYEGADGKVITDTITISATDSQHVVPGDGTNDFPEYPNEGAVRHDKTATAVGNYSETGIAKVELSMTGVPYTTGSEIDVVVMLDMTGSMSDDGMEAAEEATKAFVKEIVVNEDGSYNDNRVAVYAFNSGSSSPYELVELTAISSDAELATANTAIDTASDKQTSGGTPYEEATKQCYDVLQAAKTTNLPDGVESAADYNRQQFCVFMSDGGPTTYYGSDEKTYYGGNNNSGDVTIVSKMTNYTSSTASSWSMDLPTEYYTDAMKADDVTIYTVGLLLQNTPSNPEPWSKMTSVSSVYDSTTDSLTTIGTHYYFTSEILKQMASDESKYIDIFNVDNADKATAAFEAIAKDILAAATDVTVADKMGANYTMVFDAPNAVVDEADGGQEYYIEVTDYPLVPVYAADGETITDYTRGTGKSLLKLYFGYDASTGYYAATDADGTKAATPTFDTVTLGDKGTKYYWTTVAADGDSGVSVVGADGTTYYFVSTGDGTHNMTAGAYASGTKTSVTLTHDDGTTSTSATCQNMIIASPYFVYNAQSKMLIWTLEEIADNELTLTYFLYLNNSGGFSGTDQEIEPQTYETNQFAYVDYTNFQNNECRLEFPTPQMTWNGAQVSYVFYLVNDAGQPVNRAGRVVPFSEAVYVTDVYTYAIVWNDLEQTAGLDADRLAAELVPEVYELFDQGAKYSIHVYEDQTEVNLNNHFVINSSVDTDANTTNDGVYTTYVFNTKADGHKYTAPGAYVADNGNSPAYQSGLTYLCKSYDVTGTFEKTEHYDELYGTYYTYTVTSAAYSGSATQVPTSSMESTTGGTIIDGYVYYVDENEEIYTIVQKTDGNEAEAGFDFSNTTVAFAVVWKPQLETDTVVVDYGLDVVINVSVNDALASGVVGVRADAPANVEINSGTYTSDKAQSVDVYIDADSDENSLKELKVGTATVENMAAVRFSLDKTNGTQFNDPAVFYYESDVNYYENGTLITTSMYSSVTVIPATTVYYEDSFMAYTNSSKADGTYGTWTQEGTTLNKTQAVDRPGANKLSAAYDADNVYGYDEAYSTSATYSMGSAMKVKVKSGVSGMASFEFYGTGFDVISMTDSDSGMIIVQVYDDQDQMVKNYAVNNYYGYAYGLHEAIYTYTCVQEATETTEAVYSWVKTGAETATTAGTDGKPTENPTEGDTYVTYETGWYICESENAIYQVPVIKINSLPYGKYTAKIIASYNTVSDVTGAGSYNFYLDGIRIYDPTGVVKGEDVHDTNGIVSDAYIADGEAWPEYAELRNNIITANDFDALTEGQQTSGLIFIDNTVDTSYNFEYKISDYTSYGPNNELYLANNQAIAFNVVDAASAKDVQIGIKVATDGPVNYTINGASYTVSSATDMYYSILEHAKAGTVVIQNVGGGILSLTNIKVTYAPAADAVAANFLWMDTGSAAYALTSLRSSMVEEEIPEPNAPETEPTEPETTVPEETEPETEETVPETTVPEETVPEESVTESTVNELRNIVNKIVGALNNLFGRLFR